MELHYITLDEVNEVLTIHPDVSAKWNAYDDTIKRNNIIYAEYLIDNCSYIGETVSKTQPYAFPRWILSDAKKQFRYSMTNDTVKRNIELYDGKVPDCLKPAIIEWIVSIINESQFRMFRTLVEAGVVSLDVGVSFDFNPDHVYHTIPKLAKKHIYYLLTMWWDSNYLAWGRV